MLLLIALLAATTPAEHIAKGHDLLQALEYDEAAAELMLAAEDPAANEAERLQASFLAGMAYRIAGRDVDARKCFRYVLLRKPDWQLDDATPPKVALFFEDVRRELATSAPSTPVAAATPAPQPEPGSAPVVAGAVGGIGVVALVAGGATLAYAETALADPTKPGGERSSLRALGQWAVGGVVVGGALVAVGAALFAVGGP